MFVFVERENFLDLLLFCKEEIAFTIMKKVNFLIQKKSSSPLKARNEPGNGQMCVSGKDDNNCFIK